MGRSMFPHAHNHMFYRKHEYLCKVAFWSSNVYLTHTKAAAGPEVGNFHNFAGAALSQAAGGGHDSQAASRSHNPAPAVNLAAPSQEPCPTFQHICR